MLSRSILSVKYMEPKWIEFVGERSPYREAKTRTMKFDNIYIPVDRYCNCTVEYTRHPLVPALLSSGKASL